VSAIHRLLPVFVLMLNLILLGAALAANGRNHGRNRAFARLAAALALWSFAAAGLRWSEAPTTALAWEQLLHLGVLAIPAFLVDYVGLMAGHTRRPPIVIAGYVLAVLLAATVPTPWFMTGVVDTPWGYAPAPGPVYTAFIVYFGAFMLLALFLVARASVRTPSTFRRNRLRLVLIGVSVSLIGGAIDFARFLVGFEWLYPVGIPASAVFAVAVGIAIVRYRLMNVGLVVKRGLLYALTWAAVAPALLLTLELVDDLIPSLHAGDGAVSRRATVLTVVTALMLALPLMRKLEELLNRLMFHRQHAISEALVALNRELTSILDVPRLAATLTSGLVRRIPVAHASLHVPAGDGGAFTCLSRSTSDDCVETVDDVPRDVALWLRATRRVLVVDEIACETTADGPDAVAVQALERRGVALVVPITLDDEVAAILVIGDKLSGEVFDPAEIALIEMLAARAAIALRNARLYQHLETQMQELQATRDLYGRAQQAGRAKEQFLAVLAHELRNPLGPIVNAVHVLQVAAGRNPQAAPMIATIRRQAQQLARIVDDLLDISRVQLGKIHLSEEPVDVARLAVLCVDTLKTSGKSHGRTVTTHVPVEPLVVAGDAVRLEQVIWNLLDNALKYSPLTSPIEVSVVREDDTAVLRVRDHGIGIAPEMLTSIFDVFTQADTGLHRAQGGLGLGLALVRALVEQHRGTVTAQSEGPERGSLFEVRLPVSRHAVPALTQTPSSVPIQRPRRVLVVEDSADARDALRALLELSGHEVKSVEDGPRALDVVRTWRPDVALVDIGLPGMSGYELAGQLRRTPFGEELLLVAITGYGQPDDRRRALESGFDAHLVKPVTPEALLALIAADRTQR
jgi:signal transduction histidine kinase/ActR/RegA family two-component response regulator